MSGALGLHNSFTTTSVERESGLLDVADDKGGKKWLYVKAAAAISQYDIVTVDAAGNANSLSTANDGYGNRVGVAPVAFASGDYGWVQIYGPTTANVLASCAANVRINTTGTAGSLDDDGTATTMEVRGITLTTARGGTNGSAPAMLNFPAVGATL